MSDWQQVTFSDLQTPSCSQKTVPSQGGRDAMSAPTRDEHAAKVRAGWVRAPLARFLTLNVETVDVEPTRLYPTIGVLNRGRGLLYRDPVAGSSTSYKKLNRILPRMLIYSRLKAFEGAITVTPGDLPESFASQEFPTFAFAPDADPDFFRILTTTQSMWDALQGASKGMGGRRERVKPTDFLNIVMDIPPLPLQKRIVEILDAVDDQITALNAEADALDDLWWALGREMVAAVTDEATVPLASFCDISGGLTKNKKDLEQPDLVTVPYLRVANVHRHHLDLSEVATIQTTQAKVDKLRLRAGDILMNEGGDKDKLGRGHVWEDQIPNCIHQNHVFRVRVTDRRFDPYFVSAWGNTFGREWFETFGTQTTGIASINRATLSRFPVPDIPLSVQQDWAGRLGAIVGTMDSLRGQASSLRATRESLAAGLLDRTIDIKSAELEV
ncbi:restriction endonuclease subunit S [Streptomyces sp. NPDC058733]|uniref:restriction endonuclease subunit S n=1 Tax=Streptomyces sp. NPDC058733 TaxID=3346614 RepID=UPI003685665D